MPPVNAFWSITPYSTQQLFYNNPLNRHTVSWRTPFVRNSDASIDVYELATRARRSMRGMQ